jgi:membrane-associated phospholipid phosphatase
MFKIDHYKNYASINLSKTSLKRLIPALAFLASLIIYFYINNGFSVNSYVEIQKDLFYYINFNLSKFPVLQFNLTQLGNPLVFLGLLTAFIIYIPKLWEVMLNSIVISSLLSFFLKIIFNVPRPAVVFDNDTFVIIGETLVGYKSMPSGHSIATFTIMTILMFAFMPKKINNKIIWLFFILFIGMAIAFSRVGVGAHYPFDVLIGSCIGYISSIIGIFVNNKIKFWNWLNKIKYYPLLMLFLFMWAIAIIYELKLNNLLIFYFSLISVLLTFYFTLKKYVKK